MPLAAGQKLGPYEIVAPIGAGGMGEVYRARDARLGRDVAVKILPPELAADPERRARFEREARAVAALNHPHICVLHDVGREGDTDYLVMELVEGESLAARLARGPLALSDTIRIGAEIAEALERAHRAGILHRDLKPGNVMLAKSGAKLMDFGLARGTGAALSGSSGSQFATMSRPVTAEGHLVGTFQYMAPEQLEGREADARCDIWALGATLYEMATGERAFEGDSTASLIGAIMRAEPRPLAERAPASPASLERVIRTCLAKDPEQRWQSAGDVGRMLRGLDATSSGSVAAVAAAAPRRRAPREALAWALAALLPLAAFAAARFTAPPAGDGGALRVALALPRGAIYHFSGDFAGPPAISADGRRVAFVALDDRFGASLWVRDLDRLDAERVPGTEGGSFPFWSPDGRSLGFWSGTALKRVDLDGGAIVTICPSLSMRGASWSPSGDIVFAPEVQEGIYRVPATGGKPVRITERDTTFETTHRFPQVLPDGRHFLYFSGDHLFRGSAKNGVWVGSLDGRTKRQLLQSSTNAVYSEGHLLFLRDSTLFAQAFDSRSLRFSGEPLPLRERVQADLTTWTSNLSASADGRLAYVMLGESFGSRVEERGRDGARLRVLSPSLNHTVVFLSRDGRFLADAGQSEAASDIFGIDLGTGRRARIVQGPSDDDSPVPLPRTNELLFMSNRGGKLYAPYVQRLDGSTAPRLFATGANDLLPIDVSPDGRYALIQSGHALAATWDSLFAYPLAGGPPRLLVAASNAYGDARVSPDGRWLAYTDGTISAPQVFVTAFAPGWPEAQAPQGRWQVNGAPAAFPRWTSGGRELVFARPDGTIVSVGLDMAGGAVRAAPERELFHAPLRPQTAALDVSADGQRFYVNVLSGDDVSRLAVVTHWTSGLPPRK